MLGITRHHSLREPFTHGHAVASYQQYAKKQKQLSSTSCNALPVRASLKLVSPRLRWQRRRHFKLLSTSQQSKYPTQRGLQYASGNGTSKAHVTPHTTIMRKAKNLYQTTRSSSNERKHNTNSYTSVGHKCTVISNGSKQMQSPQSRSFNLLFLSVTSCLPWQQVTN